MVNGREYNRRVNVCWEFEGERQCKTLSKDEAYALKNDMREKGGVVFWFDPLDE